MTNVSIDESFYTNDYFHFMENRYWSGAHQERVSDINSTLPLADGGGKSALDYGCGSGYFSYCLRKKGYRVDAWDYSSAARRFLAEHYSNSDISLLESAPTVDVSNRTGGYDGILLLDVIEHIPHSEQDDFLSHIASLMKPGGWLLLSTDNQSSFFMEGLGSMIQKIDMRLTASGRAYRFVKKMEHLRPYYRRYNDSHIGLLSRDELVKKLAAVSNFYLEKEKHGFLFSSPISSLLGLIIRLKPLHSVYLIRKQM
jgi:2-polyprenyl-3-methyl-5-hydroxy-6-metoxy-1,4-benzoquinol methylase